MPDDATIVEADPGFTGMASRLNPVQLQPGMCQWVENMRLDRGVAQTRKGAKRLGDDIAAGIPPLVLPFVLGNDRAITSITFSTTTATVTTSGNHGYSNDNAINIRGATGGDATLYNGTFTISAASGNSFQYTMTGTPAANATGTLIANNGPLINSTYTGGIFASGVFSSPDYQNAEEYIVLCGTSSAFLYRQGEAIVTINYPAPGTAADEIIAESDEVSCVQAFNEFYLLREADMSQTGWGWKYTTSAGITVSGTTATVNINAHGYVADQRVRIEGSTTAAFDGNEFDIATASANSFTITVPSGTATHAAAGIAVRRVKAPLVWTGTGHFTRVPAGVPDTGVSYQTLRSVPWATYLQNRLWIPSGRDTVLISDVLDANHYDPFFQTFRANAGSNDYLIAVHPWTEGQALVFMRNSIWLATLKEDYDSGTNTLDFDTAVTRLTLLTDEIGCVARRSITTAGNFVYFLSDSGVYRLDTKLDIKLRGDTLPLSDPIADQLAEINADYAHLAVGKWFANRYHLAVPIGENAEHNNTLFLWNALNGQWESRDTYAINLDELLVASYDSARRLFAASRAGTLFLLDEMDRGDDVPQDNIEDAYTPVEGYLLTRRYGWGSVNAKRLLRAKASVLLPATGSITLRAVTTDYDADFQIATLTNSSPATEDYTLKAPLRCKATYLDLEFTTTAERPTLRQITAEATRSNFDPTETRTLN